MKIELNNPKGKGTTSTIEWWELCQFYTKLFHGTLDFDRSRYYELDRFAGQNGTWARGGYDYGSDASEICQWIKDGYRYPEKVNALALPAVTSSRRRFRYGEDPEGDFDYDQFINGESEYFINKPKRDSLVGIRLKIRTNFSSHVESRVISEYGQWCGMVIQSLQSKGYDLEIVVMSENENVFKESPFHNDTIYIRMSRFGERVMPNSWSALFAPGGHRHFIWCAKLIIPLECPTLHTESGFGRTKPSKWDIEWDEGKREIYINANQQHHSGDFPAKEMTERWESWKD